MVRSFTGAHCSYFMRYCHIIAEKNNCNFGEVMI